MILIGCEEGPYFLSIYNVPSRTILGVTFLKFILLGNSESCSMGRMHDSVMFALCTKIFWKAGGMRYHGYSSKYSSHCLDMLGDFQKG